MTRCVRCHRMVRESDGKCRGFMRSRWHRGGHSVTGIYSMRMSRDGISGDVCEIR